MSTLRHVSVFHSFLRSNTIPLSGYLTFYLSFSWRTFGSFHFLSIANNDVMNISVQVFMWTYVFQFSRFTPRSELLARGNSVLNTLRNCKIVLQIILLSHEQCTKVPISPPSHQHLLSVFFITEMLVHTKWYFIVVLIFTFLTANDDMTF